MDERKKQIEEMADDIYTNAPCLFNDDDDAKQLAGWMYKNGYQKQRVGEWETVCENRGSIIVECTSCKEQFYFAKKGQLQIDRMPHCPKCGAKMVKGSKS